MRVDHLLLRCIGFVGVKGGGESDEDIGHDLRATGFFISVPGEDSERPTRFLYFVTAKHVAVELKDEEIYFLVNRIGGGLTKVKHVGPDWFLHPTEPTADVAVVQVGKQDGLGIVAIKAGDFVSQEAIQEGKVCVGDEVFITGLFTEAPGELSTQPIVRHGNLAMIPAERIQTGLGYADVYLVEARSIGGISGSPVFVRPTVLFSVEDADGKETNVQGVRANFTLLGLMHGHWDVRESEINSPNIVHDRKRGVNYGISIVVPSAKILETLYQPGLVKMRRQKEQEAARESVPGMDSAQPKEPEFTQADFEAALKKASRRVDQGKG